MRRLPLIAAVTVAVIASCAPSGSSEVGYDGCADSPVAVQAEQMAARLTPAQAGASFGRWLAEAPLGEAPFAHRMYAALRAAYGDAAAELDKAIDSVHRAQPADVQARMVALSASPERAAVALLADSSGRALIPEMERVYSADSLLLRRFRQAIRLKQNN